jgi:hypothetical protein
MTRRSIRLVACLLVAFTTCILVETCSSARTADTYAQDMAEIDRLHHLDVAATLSGDYAAIAETCTDDCVRLQRAEEADIWQASDSRDRRTP